MIITEHNMFGLLLLMYFWCSIGCRLKDESWEIHVTSSDNTVQIFLGLVVHFV